MTWYVGCQFPGAGCGTAGCGTAGEEDRVGEWAEDGTGDAGLVEESYVRSMVSSMVTSGSSASLFIALIHCISGDNWPPLASPSISIFHF